MGHKPAHRRVAVGHRTKVHLRVRRLAGRTLRVLTLRPGTDVVLSNNYFHETWHLVTDGRGAKALAHLLWALSYQRHPGTLVLLAPPFVAASPFDGDRARPVLLVPAHLTGLDADALATLRAHLRSGTLGPPDGTVRLDTRGLAEATHLPYHEMDRAKETMGVREGFVVYRGDVRALRMAAWSAHRMRGYAGPFSSYDYLADRDGEIQIFDDFRARVVAARTARSASNIAPGFATLDQQPGLWERTERTQRAQKPARRSAAPGR